MNRLLTPTFVLSSVLELTVERLDELDVRALILDADNTLVPRNQYQLDAPVIAWIEALQASGRKLCVLSNSASPRRVAAMVAPWGIPTLSLARKPLRGGFARALRLLDTPAAQTAMVGDQLLTDILGGNAAGLRTVMVRPVSSNDFVLYRWFGRRVERRVLRRWREVLGF